ncbi:MAG: site-specific integrase, partial [Planctomycetales bacterium]
QLDKADTTLEGERTHIRHLKRVFGETKKLAALQIEDVQAYVATRLAVVPNKRKASGTTVKKELVTFTQIWTWAKRRKCVSQVCPVKDPDNPRRWAVSIPKHNATPPFQTWVEIEQRIARGGLSAEERQELWSKLYLTEDQVLELLDHVKAKATYSFIYPLFAVPALSGARRSEVCRSLIDDFNFKDDVLCVRERKRKKDRQGTTRLVPISPRLRDIMKSWFAKEHPGGQFTIAPPLHMSRRKDKTGHDQLTGDEATHHFKQALAGSKWKVLPGYHCLRHSHGAIMSSRGVPMNVIGKWMGHMTVEMMELYQHLFPTDEQQCMKKGGF